MNRRVYLQSKELGKILKEKLSKMEKTQEMAAKKLNIAQGQLSHLLAGHFKTMNSRVLHICKYLDINPQEFKVVPPNPDDLASEAKMALARACRGQEEKTKAVIRVLNALEKLDVVI